MDQNYIRNFCIIAHIDHGKSTLADRLLEMTGTVARREMQEQLLDSNPIERERGITIKLAPVRMVYRLRCHPHASEDPDSRFRGNDNFFEYILNLIDTPGHVDFNYEVSRSLAACEGAILVVDATQGVQAQTLANLNLARKQNLTIIPVINKIDLPNAQIERVLSELSSLDFRREEVILISAKTGKNVNLLLKAIVERMPPPQGLPDSPLRALVFSSRYDSHKGVMVYVRIVDGCLTGPVGRVTRLKFVASGSEIEPIEVGYFSPEMKPSPGLLTGEVGYIATGLKDVALAKVGDTITTMPNDKYQMPNEKQKFSIGHWPFSITPLAGYKEPKPMVFLGLFPIQTDEIGEVREALGKLRLSDSAFNYKPISSLALGNGFQCGFLGLLHAEVVQERLSREFNLSLLATAPTVEYKIKVKGKGENVILIRQLTEKDPRLPAPACSNGGQVSRMRNRPSGRDSSAAPQNDNTISIQSATEFPDPSLIEQTLEPVMEVTIFSPKKYVGQIMQLCQDKRGEYVDMNYIGGPSVIPAKAGIRSPSDADPHFREDDKKEDLTGLIKFTYLIPLSEMIVDFFDALKSATEGYASLDYEFFDYQPVEVVKLDILLNHEKVDAFSQLVVADRAQNVGRRLVEKLAEVIPRQQFAIPVQAAIGGQVIARADVKSFRKDVTQKLYGGDRTRKDKLLEAQKKGKARMKQVGKVEVPQEAFLKVFKRE